MKPELGLAILLTLTAACYLMLGARLVGSKRDVGAVPIGLLLIVVSVWVLGGAIELLSGSLDVFMIGRTGHFVGTALMPVLAYAGFREYTGSELATRTLALLLIIPTISIVLAASNPVHEMMWLLPASNAAGEFLTRPDRWGIWFLFVHLPYSYTVMVAAVSRLLKHSTAVAAAQRRGLHLLVAALVVPLVATMMCDFGVGPNTLSLAPLVFVAILPLYAWLILGEQIIETTPLPYEILFQHMQDPIVVIDEQCRVIGLNRTAEKLLDVEESKALRRPLETLLGDDAPEVFDALHTGAPQKMMTATGRFLHVQASNIEPSAGSAKRGRVLMFRDVSDVEQAQLEIRNSEKLLRTLIDHSVNGIIRLRWSRDEEGNRDLLAIFANAAAAKFLGKPVDELTDSPARDMLRLATTGMSKDDSAGMLERFDEAVRSGSSLDIEVLQRGGGKSRWLRMICEPVGEDFAVTFVDITDTKAKERQMESIATSDPLTGVLNRRGFERDASERLSHSADDATGALLYIDLDDFKQINDEYGHEIGDQLLTVASERLKKNLRPSDIIGRPGGDEFVALVPDVDEAVAVNLAARLTDSLERDYRIGDLELSCAASIGLALYPENARTLTGLLREADQAMYRAKARNRDRATPEGPKLVESAI